MMYTRGELLGSFSDPEIVGVNFDVYRYGPGSLAVQQTEEYYYRTAPPYNQTALEVATALGRSYKEEGVQVGIERLAANLAKGEGSAYVARLTGEPPFDETIVACGYTEESDTDRGMFLVNALEVPLSSVGLRRARFAAAAVLHCMFKGQDDKTLALFRLRVAGSETRLPYLTSLGVEFVGELERGPSRGLGWAPIGKIRRTLEDAYGLAWPVPQAAENA
jgi:hypothetical protein